MFRTLVALTTASTIFLASAPMLAHASDDASVLDGKVTGFVDAPSSSAVVSAGQPFTINGWLVDTTNSVGVGVDAIDVKAQRTGQPTIDLGQARLSLSRPDVAVALNNPNWSGAGYSLDVTGLPAGTYTLAITAHTASQGWINRTSPLTVGALTSDRWTAYGFNVDAPASMWPMLEVLHRNNFDWALAGASRKPTPIRWDDQLPRGVYGAYTPKENTIKLSTVLETTSLEARATLLAHELTHLNDDLNGLLGDIIGDNCYNAETRAFVNEANLWSMLFGRQGKQNADPIEAQENTKMWAFVGNQHFADLVVRTTGAYVTQCSS